MTESLPKTPEEALAHGWGIRSVWGKSRFHAYTSDGIPRPETMIEIYRQPSSFVILTCEVPATPEEIEIAMDLPLRDGSGHPMRVTYREHTEAA